MNDLLRDHRGLPRELLRTQPNEREGRLRHLRTCPNQVRDVPAHATHVSGASGSSATPRRYTSTGERTRSADVSAYDSTIAVSSCAIVTRDTEHRASRFLIHVPQRPRGQILEAPQHLERLAPRPAAVPNRPTAAGSNPSCTTITVALPRPARLTRPRRRTGNSACSPSSSNALDKTSSSKR